MTSSSIRRALGLVIDRSSIGRHIFIGAEVAHFDQTPLPACNLSKGKEFFELGLKELGLTREAFPPLTLSCCHLSRHKRLATYLQQRWQEVFGIVVHLDVQDWNRFYHNLQQGKFHIGGCFVSGDYDDPAAFLEPLTSTANFCQWNDARFDALVHKIRYEKNNLSRGLFIKQAVAILNEEMPMIPIINLPLYYLRHSRLKDVPIDYKGVPDLSYSYFDHVEK